jgi:hypothetical protein
MSYSHIYLPSVGYALACWPLTAAQLHKGTSPAVNAFLSKMGFCQKMSRNILFGSKSLGGFDLTPLVNYQGVNQSMLFVQHVWLMDSIGKMLVIGYSWYQHFCGVWFQSLQFPSLSIPHAPPGWFQHFRLFLSRCDMSIELLSSLIHTPALLRHGDRNLMEDFISLGWKTQKL